MGWNIIFNWCNLSCILSRKDIYLLQSRLILSNITSSMCDIVDAVYFSIRVRGESPELWWMWSEDTAFVCLRARSMVCPPLTPGVTPLLVEGPEPLPCGAQHFHPVLSFVWGAESPFWHSHVKAFLFQSTNPSFLGTCGGSREPLDSVQLHVLHRSLCWT